MDRQQTTRELLNIKQAPLSTVYDTEGLRMSDKRGSIQERARRCCSRSHGRSTITVAPPRLRAWWVIGDNALSGLRVPLSLLVYCWLVYCSLADNGSQTDASSVGFDELAMPTLHAAEDRCLIPLLYVVRSRLTRCRFLSQRDLLCHKVYPAFARAYNLRSA